MPEATDAEELRALQRRAYGRDGSLTESERRRLSELEEARREASRAFVPASAVPERTRDEAQALVAETAGVSTPAADAAIPDVHRAEKATTDEPPSPRRAAWRRMGAMAAAGAVVLTLGLGAGWALFAPRPASIPLTDEQQERRVELATGAFDPASVRAIAANEHALVWYATREDGAAQCVILDVGAQSQSECLPTDEVERGMTASLPLNAAGAGDDGQYETITATMFLSESGEPMVGIQQWGAVTTLTAQFDGAEQERVLELLDEGYEMGLSLVGRFRGAPVWLGDRISTQGSTERCLIVDVNGAAETCAAFETAISTGLGVQVVDVDATGGVTGVSSLDLQFTPRQTAYLTVTSLTSLPSVGPGDSFLVQAPPGDPIRVAPPGQDPDD